MMGIARSSLAPLLAATLLLLSSVLAGPTPPTWVSAAGQQAGYVAAWGLDADGQLGVAPCCGPRPYPWPVSSIPDAVSVAAGDRHGLAVRADGTVWSWGSDDASQLGTGAAGKVTAPA